MADHVVLDARAQEMVCEHCGERASITLPVPVDLLCKRLHAFGDLHADCQPSLTASRVKPD